MDCIKLFLKNCEEEIEIKINRKKIKYVRLKVFPDERVVISTPESVSYEWLKKFVTKKSNWIEGKLSFFRESKGVEALRFIKSGITMQILGKETAIIVRESKKKRVEREDNSLVIYSPDKNDEELLNKILEKFLKREQSEYYEKVLDKLYPIIEKYGYERPEIKIRKMKTRWGSCHVNKNRIILNYYLYKAKPPLIEYVMLHELIHMKYPKHDKDFYEFLTIHMPGWKERKKILDYEVVLGV